MADDRDVARLNNEYLHIVNKDGAFTDWEKKRLATLEQISKAEPALRNLLTDLDVRQRKEASAPQGQHKDLEQQHDKERERYIREYHEAQKIRDQTRDNEISRDRGRTR